MLLDLLIVATVSNTVSFSQSLEHLSLIETTLFVVLAGMGGLLAYILRALNNNEKPSAFRAVVEAISSGFVGFLAMLTCKAMGIDWQWSGVVVGVFGWLGAETSIAFFTKLVRSKLGLDPKKDESENDESN